jgi:hypothetical protein
MDCYIVTKLKCLEAVVDQSQVAGLMKSLCLAVLLLVVFPAADLFEEANVDSSVVSAERPEHSDHKKPIREVGNL